MNEIKNLKEEIKDIKSKINMFDLYFDNQKRTYSKVDINTIIHTSFGYCNNCINIPENATNGFLEVKELYNIVLQVYYEYNAGKMYTRFYLMNNLSEWNFTEWKQI